MIDLVKAKKAIEQVETGGSTNNYPRFERSYAPKNQWFTIQGRMVMGTGTNWNSVTAAAWQKWGMAAACSYGAAQILYFTAEAMGYMNHPAMLWADPTLHDYYVNMRLAKLVKMGADTIEKLADGWNSGNPNDANVPADYIAKVKAAYDAL